MLTPDVVIHGSGMLPGIDEVYRGHEGARRWWDELRESWERFELTHRVEAVEHDRCLVEVAVHGRGASSGIDVHQRVWHVVQLDGTRASRHWSFWDRDAALALLQERNADRPG